MTSLSQQTWVWANSGRWWWTGKPGRLQSLGLQRVGHDLATEQQQNVVICFLLSILVKFLTFKYVQECFRLFWTFCLPVCYWELDCAKKMSAWVAETLWWNRSLRWVSQDFSMRPPRPMTAAWLCSIHLSPLPNLSPHQVYIGIMYSSGQGWKEGETTSTEVGYIYSGKVGRQVA